MHLGKIFPVSLTACVIGFGLGCRKSEPPPPPSVVTVSPDEVVRVHWLGKGQLDLKADACFFSRVWLLPETERLQAQTFDRFSTGAWRILLGDAAAAQIPAAMLRPLLDDVAREEIYLEVRVPTNSQPPQACFAIHLPARRAGIWETNLAIASELLAGRPAVAEPARHGWTIQRTNAPSRITLTRIVDWTVVAAGPQQNSLSDEITARIRRDGVPFVSAGTNLWLEADVKLARLPGPLAKAWHLSGNLPEISLALAGDGANVLTRGKLIFPGPLHMDCEPWTPPTNLIREPLDSFTAVRGVRPWLSSLKIWNDLPLGAPPGQLYFWAVPGAASQAYFAAPLPDASNQVNRLTEYLLEKTNPWLATNGYVQFERLPESNGASWGNLSDIRPFFKFVNTGNGSAVFGGLLPDTTPGTNAQDNLYERPSWSRLLDQMSAQTNLVYYDWELTGTRIEPCLYLGQVSRVVSRHAQLPVASASVTWLKTIEPRLGACTTMIACTGTNQLSFFRKSTVGFTGAELQLLADWLESPQFPRGLYSAPASLPARP